MSTHYLPKLGHRTYVDGDVIPADAIPRPIVDPATHDIVHAESGYVIQEIPATVLQVKQDIVDLRAGTAGTALERMARIERMLLKLLGG